MNLTVAKSALQGEVNVPASKSHTIRAVAVAALAAGESRIERPLESADACAARRAYAMLGADVAVEASCWRIRGTGGNPTAPEDVINVENSGTTMRLALGSAALLGAGTAVHRRRPSPAQALRSPGGGAKRSRCKGPFNAEQRLSAPGGVRQAPRRRGAHRGGHEPVCEFPPLERSPGRE